MIPKKIHYVWVGNKPKSKDIQRCMKTWSKHLTDYEFIEWNENNFDINSHPFIKQAYKDKKWAYVSDYIRAYAIYHEGGIYLDTDVLVLNDLQHFLNNKAFVGFENSEYPFTAVFGAEPKHPFVKKMLDYYDNIVFSFDVKDQMKNVNTKTVSNILINEYHCKQNNQEQLLETGIRVYPDTVLCNPSTSSSAIHIFTGTWMEGSKPLKRKINKWIKLRLTNKFMIFIFNALNRF
ncbi:MAG: glycosyltransferase [Erysipelotrichaceae bacterium]